MGLDTLRSAFRLKMREDALKARSQTDPNVYQESIKLGHDVADVLRRNVVQAQRVQEARTESDKEIWRAFGCFFFPSTTPLIEIP